MPKRTFLVPLRNVPKTLVSSDVEQRRGRGGSGGACPPVGMEIQAKPWGFLWDVTPTQEKAHRH